QIGVSDNTPRIVLFASARCAACDAIRGQFAAKSKGHPDLPLMIVFKGDVERARKHAEPFSESAYAVSDRGGLILRTLNVPATPFTIVLDPEGVVLKKGVSTSPRRVDECFDLATGDGERRSVSVAEVS